jgi:hypothetical protein
LQPLFEGQGSSPKEGEGIGDVPVVQPWRNHKYVPKTPKDVHGSLGEDEISEISCASYETEFSYHTLDSEIDRIDSLGEHPCTDHDYFPSSNSNR